jgi:hypothetical protein
MYSVVGITFRPEGVQQFYYRIQAGNLGLLQREPKNEFDPNAVKVLALDHEVDKFVFIGYLPKGMSKVFSNTFATIKFLDNRKFEIIAESEYNPYMEIIDAGRK